MENDYKSEENEMSNLENQLKDELKELRHDEQRIEKDLKEIEHTLHSIKEHKEAKISLTFIVNGKQIVIEHLNPKSKLITAVEKALTESGNIGRPVSDWQVKFNDTDLNLDEEIGKLDLPKDAKIFISLKTAQGGRI